METLKALETWLNHFDTVAILGGVIFFAVSKLLSIKKKKHGIEYNSEVDKNIYKLLWPLLVKVRAVRVFILQFHNGDNFYTGQSIQRKTMSHEVVADETKVVPVKKNFDNVLVSELMHDIIGILKKENIFGVDHLDVMTDKLSPRMFNVLVAQANLYEYKSFYYVRIVDKKGMTVAILGLHWRYNSPINDHEKTYLLEYKKQIESVFNQLK